MQIEPGDLVYYINRVGVGELGMYIGKHGITDTYRYTIMWTKVPDDTTNEDREDLELYRQNYLDLRSKIG